MSDKKVLQSDLFSLLHYMGILTLNKKERKSYCFYSHSPQPPPPLSKRKKDVKHTILYFLYKVSSNGPGNLNRLLCIQLKLIT